MYFSRELVLEPFTVTFNTNNKFAYNSGNRNKIGNSG